MKKIIFYTYLILFFFSGSIYSQIGTEGFECNCTGGTGSDVDYEGHYRWTHYRKEPTGQIEVINQYCSYIELIPSFKIAAEGSESYFELYMHCLGIGEFNTEFFDNFNVDPDNNGTISVEERTNKKLVIKYIHPKNPPVGLKYKTLTIPLDYLSFDVNIYHPPIIMIHGLWSSRKSFNTMQNSLLETGLYEGYQLYMADYSSTNDKSFSTNQNLAKTSIDQVLGQCKAEKMAVQKANVIGHSMGGLLTRMFVQSPQFATEESVNKIITCNTPHQGSQMANWLLDVNSNGPNAAAALALIGKDSYQGAVGDLQVGSVALSSIQDGSPTADVKVHALVTKKSHVPELNIPPFGSGYSNILFTYAAFCGVNFMNDVFDSENSDLVVSIESQRGGLSGSSTSLYDNQIHIGSVANGEVVAEVIRLLDLPMDAPEFVSQYNKTEIFYNLNSGCSSPDSFNKSAKKTSATLNLINPAPNFSLTAGDILSVNYSSTGIDYVVAYLQQGNEVFAQLKVPASTTSFTLPTDNKLVGYSKLVLMGFSEAEGLLVNASAVITQREPSGLLELFTYPSAVYLNTGTGLGITIYGKFEDGIVREIATDDALNYSYLYQTATKVGNVINIGSEEYNEVTITVRDLWVNFTAKPNTKQAKTLAPIPAVLRMYNTTQVQAPLPVNLISFTGKNTDKGNILEWKTANESNFSHFEIERSPLAPNGGIASPKFEKIGQKTGNASENYEFHDSTPPTGAGGLYRLRLVDLDGKYRYSKVIFIKNVEKSDFTVFPNPFSNHVSIKNDSNKNLKINLIDITGKELIKPVVSSSNKIDLNTEKIGTGIYFLQIKEGEKVKIQKVIKQ